MFTGHPKGLFRLFFIEMWERLAFYTMVGILLLYATDAERGGLGLPDSVGHEIYGLYLAWRPKPNLAFRVGTQQVAKAMA